MTELSEMLGSLGPAEWEQLLHTAQEQEVTLILCERIRGVENDLRFPIQIGEQLRRASLHAVSRNMRMLHEAGLILQSLRMAGIDVIALKGLYLVEAVYKSLSIRIFADLDLLVHKEDVQQVLTCLESMGLKLSTYYCTQDANADLRHIPVMSRPGGSPVEVHWTILEENEPFIINSQGLWQRAIPVRIAGVDILALGAEDLLLHLCIHLTYQHQLKKGLRALFDVAEVLRHFQGQVDWKVFTLTAREWGVERVIWLTLMMAKELLGLEIPLQVFTQLVPYDVDPVILEEAVKQLLGGKGQTDNLTPDLAQLGTTTGTFGKLRLVMSRVFLPKQTMARLFNVSPGSLAIYGCYVKRLVILIRQYGPTIRRMIVREKAVTAGVSDEQAIVRLMGWMRLRCEGKRT